MIPHSRLSRRILETIQVHHIILLLGPRQCGKNTYGSGMASPGPSWPKMTAQASRKAVAVCGEMAGDPRYIPLLVGMGLVDLSMNPVALLEAKKIIRSIAYEQWRSIARAVLSLPSVEEIGKLLSREYEKAGLEFRCL